MAQAQVAAASSKFFKYTAFTARRHPSIQQSEHLKANPVPGFTSWYETDFKDNVHYAKTVNLQNVSSGQVTKIELTPNFSNDTNGMSLRDLVKTMKIKSQLN